MAPSVQRPTLHYQRPSTDFSAPESVGIRQAPPATGAHGSGAARFGTMARTRSPSPRPLRPRFPPSLSFPPYLSSPRKREPRARSMLSSWIPAFAGMTTGPDVDVLAMTGTEKPSSDLQRRQAHQGQDHRDDPETDHDGGLGPALLLEVMMQRRHQEDAPAGAFEPDHLDDDGD